MYCKNVYGGGPRSVKNQFCLLDLSLPKDTGYIEDQFRMCLSVGFFFFPLKGSV